MHDHRHPSRAPTGRAAVVLSALALLGLLAFASGTSAAPLAGAIFTTTPDGTIVNENVRYEDKRDVYLDGGPPPNAPAWAAGLPDGIYVFQVTDPSGKFLLSEDPAKCRLVRVAGGVIVERVSPASLGLTSTWTRNGTTFPCHIDDNPPHPTDPGVRGASGRHDTNVDADHGHDAGAIVVQLMPFGTTPNPGGVYKAWLTPLATYQAKGGNLGTVPSKLPTGQQRPHRCPDFCAAADPGFGPPHDQAKTDNFKVRAAFVPPEITVRKFHDLDGDGVWDSGEPEIGLDQCVDPGTGALIDCPGGWPYEFTEPVNGSTVTNTFFTPHTHLAAVPGTYTACEAHLTGWVQSASYRDGVAVAGPSQCVSVTVAGTSGERHEIVFGNFRPGEKNGRKLNAETGAAVAGWAVHLFGTTNLGAAVHLTTTTDATGFYRFTGLAPGSYTVCEESRFGWTQVTPSSGADCTTHTDAGTFSPAPIGYAFSLTSGQIHEGNDFVNQPPQGCTPGFWKTHSKYGPATGDHWPPTGFDPDQLVSSVFSRAGSAPYASLGSATLLQGLAFQGGSDLVGKAEILLRAAIATVLNAAHPDVSYPYTVAQIQTWVNAALDSQDEAAIVTLAGQLDAANNLGCPIGGPTD
ncbi:MAG TPA: SdrD B-like domain-containing protein [Candidatus Binatia bacterium]|nr:SdrD B-like domain-containing protein [Candidatus Binatia bacterium]